MKMRNNNKPKFNMTKWIRKLIDQIRSRYVNQENKHRLTSITQKISHCYAKSQECILQCLNQREQSSSVSQSLFHREKINKGRKGIKWFSMEKQVFITNMINTELTPPKL